jgi:hypothetical protein
MVKYLVYVLKWVALEGSHTLSSKQEETRKALSDALFSGCKWMKRLIPKTWTKVDVDPHHFDYSSLSSLFLCFTTWWFKSYLFKKI